MNPDIIDRFRELDFLIDQIYAKINKVHLIMFHQDPEMLTRKIENYRVKYLEQLHRHRKIIERQQMELIDGIDIKEIMSIMLVNDQPGKQ